MKDFNIETFITDRSNEDTIVYTVGDIVEIRINERRSFKGRIVRIDPHDSLITLDCSSEFKSNTQYVSIYEIEDICFIKR